MIFEDGSANGSGVPPAAFTAQPPKRHILRTIILTVVGVVVLGFAGILALGFYLNHQKASVAGASQAASTAAPAPGAPDFGVPMYPGATLTSAGVQTTVTPTGTSIAASYSTPDTPAQVAQFYQQQLGDGVQIMTMPDSTVMMSMGTPGNATTVIAQPNNGQTMMHFDHGRATAQ